MGDTKSKKFTAASRLEYHRMNFLLQASDLMVKQVAKARENPSTNDNTASTSSSGFPGNIPDSSRPKEASNIAPQSEDPQQNLSLPEYNLSRLLCLSARQVGKKAVLRIDPEIKRRICRRCHLQLSPGLTCSVRVKKNKAKKLTKITTCLSCGQVHKILLDPNYKLRSEDAPSELLS